MYKFDKKTIVDIAKQADIITIVKFLSAGIHNEIIINMVINDKYPDLRKYNYYRENSNIFYIKMLKYIHLLDREYNYKYISGNPNLQYNILRQFNSNKNKLLLFSCYLNSLETVKYAIENGADIHTENDKALRSAIESRFMNIANYLTNISLNLKT